MTSLEARVVYGNLGNCLVNLPSSFILPIIDSTHILVQQVVVKLIDPNKDEIIASLGWTGFTSKDKFEVEIDSIYAKTLNLNEGTPITVSLDLDLLDSPQANSVELEPLSSSDWELTELYAESIEDKFLSQVRCVSLNQKLIIRTNTLSTGNSNIVNFIIKSIKTVQSDVPFALIGNQTELHIIPKIHNQPKKSVISDEKKKKSVSSRRSTAVIGTRLERICRSTVDENGSGITIYVSLQEEFTGLGFVYVSVIRGPGTPNIATKVTEKEIEMGLDADAFGNGVIAKLVQVEESEDDIDAINVKLSPLLAATLGIENSYGELICIQSSARKNIRIDQADCELFVRGFVSDSSFTLDQKGNLSLVNGGKKDHILEERKQLSALLKKILVELSSSSELPLTNLMKLPIIEGVLPLGGRLQIVSKSKMMKAKGFNPWIVLEQAKDFDLKFKGDELIPRSRLQIVEKRHDFKIIAQDQAKKDLQKNLRYFVSTYLYGKAGSGKSLFSMKMKQDFEQLGFYVKLVDFDKDLEDTVEQDDHKRPKDRNKIITSLIESVFNAAIWHSPSLVIFENIDKIIPKTLEQGDSGASDRLTEFIINKIENLVKGRKVSLLLTGKSKDSINQLIFQKHVTEEEIHLKTPTKDQRHLILEYMLNQKFPQHCTDLNFIADVTHETEGYYPSDFNNLIDRVYHDMISNGDKTFSEDNFNRSIVGYTPTSLRGVKLQKDTGAKWSDIGGLLDVKNILLETLEWPTKYAPIFESCPLRLRSGILLFGYPGCGKTMLASAIASQTGLNFISVKGPEILNKYIGASEQSVRELFERAQSAKPCVLFFDEFDSIAPKRGHDSTGVTDRIVNQLLTQMDGAEGLDGVYVLGATSRPDLIDSALLRPGRLDKSILCDLPDFDNRRDILHTVVKGNGFQLAHDADLNEIARNTENFTGADLQAVVYNAYLKSVHEVLDNADTEKEVAEEPDKVTFKLLPSVSELNKIRSIRNKEVSLIKKIENVMANVSHEKLDDLFNEETIQKKPKILIKHEHILASLKETKPSISIKELQKFKKIYTEFQDSKRPGEMKNADDNSTDVGVRSSLM